MDLIKLNQRIELIKSNQGMVLIKSSHDIISLHLVIWSISIDGITLNSNKQGPQ